MSNTMTYEVPTDFINTLTFAVDETTLLRKIVYAFDRHLHMIVGEVLRRIKAGRTVRGTPLNMVGMRSGIAINDNVFEITSVIGEVFTFWVSNGILFFKCAKIEQLNRKIGILYWRMMKPDMFVKVDNSYTMKLRVLYAMSAAQEAGLNGFAGELRDMVEEGVV